MSAPSPAETSDDAFRLAGADFPLDDRELAMAARGAACVLFSGPAHVRALALRIHRLSSWRWGPFQDVDCGAPESVLERELFSVLAADLVPSGVHSPSGRVLQAGTLFLAEIGKLRTDAQARLRDLLAERGGEPLRCRPRRIMASTSEPLFPRVTAGTFDDRLFYRLNAFHFILTSH